MSKRVTGPDQKPAPHPFYGDSYERGSDPWHPLAFVGTPGEGRMGNENAPRREGWFLIDGCGNEIGWVPDGTEVNQPSSFDVLIISGAELSE